MKNNKPTIKAIDKNHLKQFISDEIKLNGNECDLNFIDTSNIKDMTDLFYESKFNGNISNWNTSNVKDMSGMFSESKFNGNISNWDVSNIKNMSDMFSSSKFNGDISNWNTSNVMYMPYMFFNSKFENDISNWDIQNVLNIEDIFYKSKSINIPYWAKIKDNEERIKGYQAYHAKKEKVLIFNNLNEDNNLIKLNKDIIKI